MNFDLKEEKIMIKKLYSRFCSMYEYCLKKLEVYFLKKANSFVNSKIKSSTDEIVENFRKYREEYEKFSVEELVQRKLIVKDLLVSQKQAKDSTYISFSALLTVILFIIAPVFSLIIYLPGHTSTFTSKVLDYKVSFYNNISISESDYNNAIMELSNTILQATSNLLIKAIIYVALGFLLLLIIFKRLEVRENTKIIVLERRLKAIEDLINDKRLLIND